MNLRAAIVASILALASLGFTAEQKKISSTLSASPVMQIEVNATLGKVEEAIGTLPGMNALKPARRSAKGGAASRDYIILELEKIFERAKPHFKLTPRRVVFDARAITGSKDAKRALQKLVEWGFVSKVGPLATGPKATIGLKDFGDAVGFFVARLSDLSHSPDPKFSPAMMEKLRGG